MMGEQVATTKRGKPAKSEGRSLTKDLILEAALALVDEIGLEKFSVRTLADRLSVYPARYAGGFPPGTPFSLK